MKKLLITRAEKNREEIVDRLGSGGFSVFIEPLFSVEKKPNFLEGAAKKSKFSLIITSSNACESIIRSDLSKDIRIYAIGKKTAENLLKEGFSNIIFADERSAQSLKEKIIKIHDKSEKLIYFRGSIITLDFKKYLGDLEYDVEDFLSYKTMEKDNFSSELLEVINDGQKFDYILVFSKNSAKILFNLIKGHNLIEYFQDSKILSFSDEISAYVENLEMEFGFSFIFKGRFNEVKILEKIYE